MVIAFTMMVMSFMGKRHIYHHKVFAPGKLSDSQGNILRL